MISTVCSSEYGFFSWNLRHDSLKRFDVILHPEDVAAARADDVVRRIGVDEAGILDRYNTFADRPIGVLRVRRTCLVAGIVRRAGVQRILFHDVLCLDDAHRVDSDGGRCSVRSYNDIMNF